MKQAKKFDKGKTNWGLLWFPCIENLTRVMTFGIKKGYGFENWKGKMHKWKIRNAMMRHMVALMDGEYIDRESNLPHTSHIMANCMMYDWQWVHEFDKIK